MISNIMIVDDNKIDLFVHQKIIEKHNSNIKINCYNNPLSALNSLKASYSAENFKAINIPDVILLDVNMPQMNGFEFIKHLKKMEIQSKNRIRVFMLSSSHYSKDIQRAKKNSGCFGYISKPLTLEKLKGIEKQTIIKKDCVIPQFFLSLE